MHKVNYLIYQIPDKHNWILLKTYYSIFNFTLYALVIKFSSINSEVTVAFSNNHQKSKINVCFIFGPKFKILFFPILIFSLKACKFPIDMQISQKLFLSHFKILRKNIICIFVTKKVQKTQKPKKKEN